MRRSRCQKKSKIEVEMTFQISLSICMSQEKTITDAEHELDEIFTRGVSDFIDPDGTFKQKVLKHIAGEYKKPIIVKFGVDPTRPDIHLGHAVVFRKLRALQNLGCKVVFLIGDYTAMIGDPTGKSKVRPEVDFAEVERNTLSFLEQIDKILKVEKIEKMVANGGKNNRCVWLDTQLRLVFVGNRHTSNTTKYYYYRYRQQRT
jgi:tyrosyl-tRNA synthetase